MKPIKLWKRNTTFKDFLYLMLLSNFPLTYYVKCVKLHIYGFHNNHYSKTAFFRIFFLMKNSSKNGFSDANMLIYIARVNFGEKGWKGPGGRVGLNSSFLYNNIHNNRGTEFFPQTKLFLSLYICLTWRSNSFKFRILILYNLYILNISLK